MLTFNGRDIIWYAVYYNNPNNRGTICYFCCSLSIVPTITVQASIRTPATSSFIAGQSYSFTCDGFVTVDGTLSVNTTVTWFVLMELWHHKLVELSALLSTHFKSLMLDSTPVMSVCPHHFLLVLMSLLIHSPSIYCVRCLSVNVCIICAEFWGTQCGVIPS